MNLKKIVFYIFIIFMVFLIYKLTYKEKFNYVSLGGSLAVGINSFDEISYGYDDYLVDYFSQNDLLNSYVTEFTNQSYKVKNLIDDINNNKTIIVNEKSINIKKQLRESTLVTISVGFDEFAESIKNSIKEKDVINKLLLKITMDAIFKDFKDLITSIKKYAKKDIFIIGFYNPYPYNLTYKADIEELVKYSDEVLEDICKQNNISFINISSIFENYKQYFSNNLNIYPNTKGYEKIFIQIKNKLKEI